MDPNTIKILLVKTGHNPITLVSSKCVYYICPAMSMLYNIYSLVTVFTMHIHCNNVDLIYYYSYLYSIITKEKKLMLVNCVCISGGCTIISSYQNGALL